MAKVVIDTYEGDDRKPILRHTFIGKTKKEALHFFKAHLKTDSFLRACEVKGRWKSIDCRNVRRK